MHLFPREMHTKKEQGISSRDFGSSEQILRALLCTILPALGSMLLSNASGAQQKNAWSSLLLPHSDPRWPGCYPHNCKSIWSYLHRPLQKMVVLQEDLSSLLVGTSSHPEQLNQM